MSFEDREWKPNNRPQSTIARTFSADLNNVFKIDDSRIDARLGEHSLGGSGDLGQLSEAVEQKKQAVSSQSQELEALEARLRATEERLRQRSPAVGLSSNSRLPGVPEANAQARPSAPTTHASETQHEEQSEQHLAPPGHLGSSQEARLQSHLQPSDTPPAMPGALPETPLDEREPEYLGGRQ